MGFHEHMGHSQHHLVQILSGDNPWQMAGFAAIFSFSFLASLHCAGMCGPLACSVLARQGRPKYSHLFLYNLGRLISYTLAGMVSGFTAAQFTQNSLALGKTLAIVSGILLIVWALVPLIPKKRFLQSRPQLWLQQVKAYTLRLPLALQALCLGLLTIFLPCMTLHPLLLASAGSGSAWAGALTMLAFYLGTLPAMLSATYMPSLLTRHFPVLKVFWLGRIMLVFAGFITILRGC